MMWPNCGTRGVRRRLALGDGAAGLRLAAPYSHGARAPPAVGAAT